MATRMWHNHSLNHTGDVIQVLWLNQEAQTTETQVFKKSVALYEEINLNLYVMCLYHTQQAAAALSLVFTVCFGIF